MKAETRQTSQYARSLIEASLDPLVTINAGGKIVDVNEATVNVTGVSRKNLMGTDFFDYFTEPQRAREVYLEVFAKGSIADSPLTLRHKQGKLTDVLFNGSVYKDDKGNVLGVVIVARDVTAQKLLSKYSLSLIEASLDPLVTISPQGKITDVNEATVNVTGVSRNRLKGTDFFAYFTEPDKAREGYKQVFAKGFVADYPLTLKHKKGKLTDVLFNGSVYKDDRGNVLGVVVVARDVTDQKIIKNKLIEATRIAKEAVKAKQQFLSNMSHEIRTPMNAIIGFTKVLLKTKLDAKQVEYLTAIKISGDALIVLINDILDLAKVEAGKMTFEKTPFKVFASISAMLHLFEPKIQEKNLQLIKQYDPAIPEVLVGDPVRLHQVILNLVSNAVKFTSHGNIIVSVCLVSQDEENATVKFAVTDTGIGIPENRQDNVFESFQQATSNTSRLYGGTGLGLAIVKQLVEGQGGTLSVKSVLGEGSTFSFTLEFMKTLAEAEAEVEEEEEFELGLKNIKILVVEDIALNQLLMKTLLDEFGFESDIAANGRIAVEKLQEFSYDLILMDLQMPEMNGFDATEIIRKKMNSQIPIIALTADVTTVDVAKCRAVGMNDYLAKPIDGRALYLKIVKQVKKSGFKRSLTANDTKKKNGQKKCTDLTYLRKLTGGNAERIMELITLYLKQTPVLLTSMRQSLYKSDWNTLGITAHSIIPSFSIVGINKDFELITKSIQDYAMSGTHLDAIEELVLQIEKVCNQACKELEEEFDALCKISETNIQLPLQTPKNA
jgi:PAS domain S-box-containing protein